MQAFVLVDKTGFEPVTDSFQANCSTTELIVCEPASGYASLFIYWLPVSSHTSKNFGFYPTFCPTQLFVPADIVSVRPVLNCPFRVTGCLLGYSLGVAAHWESGSQPVMGI